MRLAELVQRLVFINKEGALTGDRITLLAACPNSAAVMEAAVKAAALNHAPMLFAATLNQVDRDGGYTGWTQRAFTRELSACASRYDWQGPLYACLDHGGPWLKDRHTLDKLSFEDTFAEVKASISACLEAGYELLHIDPTVDRRLSPGEIPPVESVVDRTVELIRHAEAERARMGLPAVVYEVGTEEVHGGLVDFERFQFFLGLLKDKLQQANLSQAWPGFVVAQVGTDLHTTTFEQGVARRLCDLVAGYGSLVKGHYTDWVENAQAYPEAGMGGANVGPEFTAAEYLALKELEMKERAMARSGQPLSKFSAILTQAVVQSGRWKKWLRADEQSKPFQELSPDRQEWLVQTGARYIWTEPSVQEARERLYNQLSRVMPDPHSYIIDRIAASIDHYINRFNLFNSMARFG